MASAYLISVAGWPAIGVRPGFTARAGGLPVGLQLVGRRRGDWQLLARGARMGGATGYAAVMPASAPALTSVPPAAHPHSEPRLSARAGDVLANCYTSGFKQPMR